MKELSLFDLAFVELEPVQIQDDFYSKAKREYEIFLQKDFLSSSHCCNLRYGPEDKIYTHEKYFQYQVSRPKLLKPLEEVTIDYSMMSSGFNSVRKLNKKRAIVVWSDFLNTTTVMLEDGSLYCTSEQYLLRKIQD